MSRSLDILSALRLHFRHQDFRWPRRRQSGQANVGIARQGVICPRLPVIRFRGGLPLRRNKQIAVPSCLEIAFDLLLNAVRRRELALLSGLGLRPIGVPRLAIDLCDGVVYATQGGHLFQRLTI